jgi:hypothetical protein
MILIIVTALYGAISTSVTTNFPVGGTDFFFIYVKIVKVKFDYPGNSNSLSFSSGDHAWLLRRWNCGMEDSQWPTKN